MGGQAASLLLIVDGSRVYVEIQSVWWGPGEIEATGWDGKTEVALGCCLFLVLGIEGLVSVSFSVLSHPHAMW